MSGYAAPVWSRSPSMGRDIDEAAADASARTPVRLASRRLKPWRERRSSGGAGATLARTSSGTAMVGFRPAQPGYALVPSGSRATGAGLVPRVTLGYRAPSVWRFRWRLGIPASFMGAFQARRLPLALMNRVTPTARAVIGAWISGCDCVPGATVTPFRPAA